MSENNLPIVIGKKLRAFIKAHQPADVPVNLYAPDFRALFQAILDWRLKKSFEWLVWIFSNYPGQLADNVRQYVEAFCELRAGGAKMFFAYDEEIDEERGVVVYTPKYMYFSCDFWIQMRLGDSETASFYQMAADIIKPPTIEVALPQLKSWEAVEEDCFNEWFDCRILEID